MAKNQKLVQSILEHFKKKGGRGVEWRNFGKNLHFMPKLHSFFCETQFDCFISKTQYPFRPKLSGYILTKRVVQFGKYFRNFTKYIYYIVMKLKSDYDEHLVSNTYNWLKSGGKGEKAPSA